MLVLSSDAAKGEAEAQPAVGSSSIVTISWHPQASCVSTQCLAVRCARGTSQTGAGGLFCLGTLISTCCSLGPPCQHPSTTGPIHPLSCVLCCPVSAGIGSAAVQHPRLCSSTTQAGAHQGSRCHGSRWSARVRQTSSHTCKRQESKRQQCSQHGQAAHGSWGGGRVPHGHQWLCIKAAALLPYAPSQAAPRHTRHRVRERCSKKSCAACNR